MDKATKDEFTKLHRKVDVGFKKSDASLVKLTTLVEKGFAAAMEDAAETRKEFTARFVSIEGRLMNIEQEVRGIRRDFEVLKEKVGNIEGYGKEIDHGLERIAAIEKHLGIRPKFA